MLQGDWVTTFKRVDDSCVEGAWEEGNLPPLEEVSSVPLPPVEEMDVAGGVYGV
jgi:hypothetical protein